MNKFDSNSTTNGDDKASRVAEAKKQLDLLFGHVTGKRFGYLWLKTAKSRGGRTVSYLVTDDDQRGKMAQDAISFSDGGKDVYVGVNVTDIPPKSCFRSVKKADEKNPAVVTFQTAIVTDIDTLGGNHIDGKKFVGDEPVVYPSTFDDAKSFLPFAMSMLVSSGYGLHGYAIFAEAVNVTADNADALEERGKKFLDVIRNRAGKYRHVVDGVHDLPRVLRVAGTRNFKTGVSTDAPLCHIVEVNDVRFSPAELDEKIADFTPKPPTMKEPPPTFDRPKNLSTDIQNLIGEINSKITPAELEAKGYLEKSANGDYVCVWCDSGHGDDQSGAMHYYEEGATSHFTCFSTRKFSGNHGGDIVDFFAQVWHVDKHGKNFYDLLKKIADEFSIPYDEKIFRSKRAVNNLPIDLVLPADVEFQGNSIVLVGKKKKNDSEPPRYTASRTLILPTKKFVSDGSGKVSYEVSIHLPDGTWKRAETDKRTLLDPSRIFELTEQDADVASPKVLTSYFSKLLALPENDALIPKVIVYNRPGWRDGKFIYPVPADGENYRVERSGINYASIFTPKGDANKWLLKFDNIADSKNQGALKRIVLGACLVAPLLEIIGGMNPQFNLWGSSNLAKTPLVKLGMSIYGNPSEGEMMRTWNATVKNMLTMSAGFNGLPLFVDEGETMSKRTQDELSKFVYDFSIGVIGEANKRDGSVRETEKFRSVRFSTAERPLHDTADKRGAYKRLIDLHVSKPIFDDKEAYNLHKFRESNYGHFGRKWTQHVEANKADIAKDFERACDYFAAGGFTRDGLHAELKSVDATNARAVIACAVAFWHFYHCVGLEDYFDYVQARLDAEQILAELPTIDEMSDVKRSIRLLASWVAEHPKSFITPKKYNGTPIEGEDNPADSFAGTVGKKFADGRIAISINAFQKIVTELRLPSYEKFLCDLYDADCLECKSSREKSKTVRLGDTSPRAYYFKAGVLFPNDDD